MIKQCKYILASAVILSLTPYGASCMQEEDLSYAQRMQKIETQYSNRTYEELTNELTHLIAERDVERKRTNQLVRKYQTELYKVCETGYIERYQPQKGQHDDYIRSRNNLGNCVEAIDYIKELLKNKENK